MTRQDAGKPATLEAVRIRAVKRARAGDSPEAVIGALGFSSRCISSWLAMYRGRACHALRTKRIPGRPMKLKTQDILWVYRTLTGRNPLQVGFPFALLTHTIFEPLIFNPTGAHLRLMSVERLLAQVVLNCQKPLWRAYQQDSTRAQQCAKREQLRVATTTQGTKPEIYFGDKTGVRSDTDRFQCR